MGLIYQEICYSSISSVCIKRNEDWSKKQVKKRCSLSFDKLLDRCLLLRLNMKLNR